MEVNIFVKRTALFFVLKLQSGVSLFEKHGETND